MGRLLVFMTIFTLLLSPVKAFAAVAPLPAGCSNIISSANFINNPAQKKAYEQNWPACFPPGGGGGTTAKTGIQGILTSLSNGIAQVQAVLSTVSLGVFMFLVSFSIIISGVRIAFGNAPPAVGLVKMAFSITIVYGLVTWGPAILDGIFQYFQGQGDEVGKTVLAGIRQAYQPGHGGLINSTSMANLPTSVSLDAGKILAEGINVASALTTAMVPHSFSLETILGFWAQIFVGTLIAIAFVIIFGIVSIEAAWLVLETNMIVMLSSLVFAISVLDPFRGHIKTVFEVVIKQCFKILVLYIVLALGYVISQASYNAATTFSGSFYAAFELLGIALMYGIIVMRHNKVADIIFSGTTGSAMSGLMAIYNSSSSIVKSFADEKGIGNKAMKLAGSAVKAGAGAATGGAATVASAAGKAIKTVAKGMKKSSAEEKANTPGPNTVSQKDGSKMSPPSKDTGQVNKSIPSVSFPSPQNKASSSPSPSPSAPSSPSTGPEKTKDTGKK